MTEWYSSVSVEHLHLSRRDLLISAGAGILSGLTPSGSSLAQQGNAVSKTATMQFDSSFGARGDGSTDNVNAFLAFRKIVLALNRSEPRTIIQLDLTPDATYCSSNPYVLAGLNNLVVNGQGAAFLSTAGGANDDYVLWWCGGFGYVDSLEGTRSSIGFSINEIPYPIETVDVGANGVTCIDPSHAANMIEGQWVLVSSQCCYYAGSPPAMRYFDYAVVTAVDRNAGFIQFDRKIANTHLSTLPARFKSATFPSAATVFPLGPNFDVRQRYQNVKFLAPPRPRAGGRYVIAQGVQVDFEGGSVKGGVTPSQLIRGTCKNVAIAGGGNVFEIDKLVGTFSFIQSDIEGPISIGASTGPIEFDNCNCTGGIVQPGQNLVIRNSRFSKVSLNGCLHGVFENNAPCIVGIWPTAPNGNHSLTIDGTVVKYAGGTISIPYSEISSNYYVWAFICAIWPSAILNITRIFSGFNGGTGGRMIVRSMVDVAGDMHLNVGVFSQTCTAVEVVESGHAYKVGDQIRLTNEVGLTVTALSGTGVAKVSVVQAISSQQFADNIAQASSSGSGVGAIFNLTFGVPNGTVITAPIMLSYSGRGNTNGEASLIMSDDNFDSGTMPGFVDGDNSARSGNSRYARIVPRSGYSVSYLRQHAAGHIKNISVNVIKPYRGSQFPANNLFLRIAEEYPIFRGIEVLVNLSIAGQRVLTASAARGVLAGDVMKPTDAYISAYDVGISHNGVYPALIDPADQLPIVELEIELEELMPT